MILSFHDAETEEIFRGGISRRFPREIHGAAVRKMVYLWEATSLQDLAAIPGNRFEKLHRDRAGQYRIRVNDQYRICFEWNEKNAHNVELCDYH